MANHVASLAGTDVILLAGGRGTRLADVVRDLPKPMAPIAGRPFLEYLLASLQQEGFTRAVLSVGYRADSIRNFFGDRSAGMDLSYCREKQPLGTGGAIRAAARSCSSDHVFVVNADTLATIDYAAMLKQHLAVNAGLSLALVRVPDAARYGAVELAGTEVHGFQVRGFQEKGRTGPGYINAGIYLLRRTLLETLDLPEAFSFEEEVLRKRMHQLHPAAFLASGYFIDIGIPEDYARAQQELPGT